MTASFIPSKITLLRTSGTLLIGAIGGGLFTWLQLPAGLVSGSLIAVATAALLGAPVLVPRQLARAISVLVGISLGAVVTPETLQGLGQYPLSIAVLLVSTAVMMAATAFYLQAVHGWDKQSAVFGASPGALAQVMILAADYGADLRAIAIVQVMRVVVLTIGIPAGLALFGLTVHGVYLPRSGSIASIGEFTILVLVSITTAVLLTKSRLPGGPMFGAMIGSAVLHGSGYIHALLPPWVAICAVIGIGSVTGARFAGTDPRALLRLLGAALGSLAVAVSVATCFVVLLCTFTSISVANAVVAFAPGAQDTMMVLALALHLDPIFVGAHHVSRFILVSVMMPLWSRRVRHAPPPAKAERPAARPTIED